MTGDQSRQLSSWLKIALLVISIVTCSLVFILYLQTLSAPALYDENYLLAWNQQVLKDGFSAISNFLNFAGCDVRDGTMPLGNLLSLICVGTGKIGLLHFMAVVMHMGNSVLLLVASLKAQLLPQIDSEQKTAAEIAALAVSTFATLVFALNPLAPEAVSWIGAIPLELGTTASLVALLLLCLSAERNGSMALTVCASVAGLLATLYSSHLAIPALIPAVVVFCSTRKIDTSKKYLLIYGAVVSVGVIISTAMYLSRSPGDVTHQAPVIAALKESREEQPLLSQTALGNVSVLTLPINKSTNKNYNKKFKFSYLLLPAPLIFSLIALILSSSFRSRLGMALAITTIYLLLNGEALVDRETLVGARWLYPILPTFAFLLGCTVASPLFITWKNGNGLMMRSIKSAVCAIVLLPILLFLIPLTHTQISSYKSQGKLWTKLCRSIELIGGKEQSPYLLIRNLPQTLCVAPVLSPFQPLLIDTQQHLPRSQAVSAGALKDCLRSNEKKKIGNIVVHFEKHLFDLIKTDFAERTITFAPRLEAKDIAHLVTPPLQYYNGAIKLDATNENLLLESNNTNGAALRLDCDGISPTSGDYFYVEAKLDGAALKPHTPIEMHWLTNWNTEWEPRDRKTVVDAFNNDGLYHRYSFPLRSSAWTTNGYTSHIMLGFPAGCSVAVRAIGVESKSIPMLSAQAQNIQVKSQSEAERKFAAFCFNYPDTPELGLCAVYGRDNSLILTYDASQQENAASVKIEVGPADSTFKADNAEYPQDNSTVIEQKTSKGTLLLKSTEFHHTREIGSVYPVRVFALDQAGKIVGRASDSVHCLIDP